MARVFITGSSDGLGRMAAALLVEQGHGVVLHARNPQRGREAMSAVPQAETVVVGDLASIAQAGHALGGGAGCGAAADNDAGSGPDHLR